MIINLKEFANELLHNIEQDFSKICGIANLTIVTVGEDPASLIYVKNKQKKCEKIPNVKCDWIKLDNDIHEEDLFLILDSLSYNRDVHGILLQQPLPEHINAKSALTHIAPEKDIDGLTQMNKRFLYTGDNDNSITPCTALGILMFMANYFPDGIAGKTVLVVGRSDLVGRPLAHAIEQSDATLIWANSHTHPETLCSLSHQADIIICAVGIEGFIYSDYVNARKKQLFIDVGINRNAEGKIVGDCNLNHVADAGMCDVTAVPGGVGQLTTTALLYNLYKCWTQ